MAEKQPPTIVEGATTGDIEDEIPVAAKSAEDRKAAAALSSLDTREDESPSTAKDVDREAVKKAMDRLAATGGYGGGNANKKDEGKKEPPKPAVKVDQADVAYLVCHLISYTICWLVNRYKSIYFFEGTMELPLSTPLPNEPFPRFDNISLFHPTQLLSVYSSAQHCTSASQDTPADYLHHRLKNLNSLSPRPSNY